MCVLTWWCKDPISSRSRHPYKLLLPRLCQLWPFQLHGPLSNFSWYPLHLNKSFQPMFLVSVQSSQHTSQLQLYLMMICKLIHHKLKFISIIPKHILRILGSKIEYNITRFVWERIPSVVWLFRFQWLQLRAQLYYPCIMPETRTVKS